MSVLLPIVNKKGKLMMQTLFMEFNTLRGAIIQFSRESIVYAIEIADGSIYTNVTYMRLGAQHTETVEYDYHKLREWWHN